ncbi:MAG: Nif3-like dinuclear metal center hexameric protein [Eubacteriales bacterium]|nr:Nif3-like dinuclear metal center hexameric protein [Eubacteriales bacterium]
MSVALDDIVRAIETIAPPCLAYDWDNTGLLLRCAGRVHNVLIALDVTQTVIDEAVAFDCDMILCHHPLIFTPVTSLSCNITTDALLMRLIKSGVSLYAAHTSYDRAKGGINDGLAEKLGLCRIETVSGCGEDLMRTGHLTEPCGKEPFLDRVKQALGIKTLKISGTSCDIIDKVAVIGGSGGEFVTAAKTHGAQALITGEAKHHHFIDARFQGLLLVEAGHFATEIGFTHDVFISLQSCLNELQLDLGLRKANCEKAPYEYC